MENKEEIDEKEEEKVVEPVIISLLKTDSDVSNEFVIQNSNFSKEKVLRSLNRLLAKEKILITQHDGVIYCRLREKRGSYDGMTDPEEMAVYNVISLAGNKGIWNRDIRNSTNLTMQHLTKILKGLENKRKIKSVKSVMAAKKKVYMLYELTPDTKVTGDVFYSDQQEFDTEFTELMFRAVIRFLNAKSQRAAALKLGPRMHREQCFASVKEILKHIEDSQLFTVKIEEADMKKVLRSLAFSGKIESSKVDPDTREIVDRYRIVAPLVSKPSLVCMPCGACPVQLQCSDTGAITPSKCKYLTEWLDLGLPIEAPGGPSATAPHM